MDIRKKGYRIDFHEDEMAIPREESAFAMAADSLAERVIQEVNNDGPNND